MVSYDDKIIRRFAQGLYDQANMAIILFTLIGVLAGGGLGSLIARETGMFVGAALVGVIGFMLGQGRAFQLKLQAQMALCHVQIEQNTRSSGSLAQEMLAPTEEEYYARNGVLVTNKRLVVPPDEWLIEQFQPVQVTSHRDKYRIELYDQSGRHIHFFGI
jgi:hypothetical protein